MEKINNQKNNDTNISTGQEAIMNRVNETFEKISQDVRDMINENNQRNNIQ